MIRWKQFFTPVKSVDARRGHEMVDRMSPDELTILDVRQPREYRAGHLAGARLIPMAQLDERLSELDREKNILVYCAVGGRSRVASQVLAGRGYEHVYNLAGGFKAWQGHSALGDQESGLTFFADLDEPESVLKVAYSLEQGLRDFYLLMAAKVDNEQARNLFTMLADIEIKHQDSIFNMYKNVLKGDASREQFTARVTVEAGEGGMTTEEYIALFQADPNSPVEIAGVAMSIEAQALDLYQRAALKSLSSEGREILNAISMEEKAHLRMLGELIDNIS